MGPVRTEDLPVYHPLLMQGIHPQVGADTFPSSHHETTWLYACPAGGGGVEVRGSRPLAVSSPLHGPFEADPGGPLGLMRRERRLQHSVQ